MKQKLTERQKTYLYKLHGLKLDSYEVIDNSFRHTILVRAFNKNESYKLKIPKTESLYSIQANNEK